MLFDLNSPKFLAMRLRNRVAVCSSSFFTSRSTTNDHPLTSPNNISSFCSPTSKVARQCPLTMGTLLEVDVLAVQRLLILCAVWVSYQILPSFRVVRGSTSISALLQCWAKFLNGFLKQNQVANASSSQSSTFSTLPSADSTSILS